MRRPRRLWSVGVLVVAAACSAGGDPATGAPSREQPRASSTEALDPPSIAVRTRLVPPASGTPSQVVRRLRVGGQPCGVVGAFGAIWVTDAQNARLLRVDAAGRRVVARYRLDATPCELTAAFGRLWVATQSGVLDRVDPRTGRSTSIAVGSTSYEVVAAFGAVWVSNRGDGTVSKVDPHSGRVLATVRIPGVAPGGLVAGGGALWVGNDTAGARNLARIDPAILRVSRASAGMRPAFVAFAAGSVWVADENDGTVTRLSARSGRRLGRVPAGARPVNLAALPGARPEVWVPDDAASTLTRIDAASGTLLERIAAGAGPAVVAPVAGDVWVTNFEDGTIWRVRPGRR